MKPEYSAYLEELIEKELQHYHPTDRPNVTRPMVLRAKCQSFTVKFVEKFPHLQRVAGFYGNPDVDVENMQATEHFWCVDTDGSIVDPTAEQFRPGGSYTVFDPDVHRIQIGRCMECGDYIYGLRKEGPKSACSADCLERLTAYYNSI